MPCNDTIMTYCLNGPMLDDHCCCESRHATGNVVTHILYILFSSQQSHIDLTNQLSISKMGRSNGNESMAM